MKYMQDQLDEVCFRVRKGNKANLQAEATMQGQSMAQCMIQTVNERAGKQVQTPSENASE